MDPTPEPCPTCKVDPVIKHDSKSDQGPIYVACGNEVDCPVWPIGYPAETEAAAIDHWNHHHYI